jgi:hypothetical protein
MIYAVVSNSAVVNLIEYDGQSPFDPGPGCALVAVPDDLRVSTGWTYDGSAFHAPTQPAAVTPTSYYISKVAYERRIRNVSLMAYLVLDAIRVAVANRPADWASSIVQPWPTYRGYSPAFVPDLIDYVGSAELNVLDPAPALLLGMLQQSMSVFGTDRPTADAAIAQILSPAPLPGELSA